MNDTHLWDCKTWYQESKDICNAYLQRDCESSYLKKKLKDNADSQN